MRSTMDGECNLEESNAQCNGKIVSGTTSSDAKETVEDWKTWVNTITVTAGAEKLTAAADEPKATTATTATSANGPKKTDDADKDKDGDDEEDKDGEGDDDDSGAVGLACSSLLAAAAAAVGVMLI